jgi:hypothetical protein
MRREVTSVDDLRAIVGEPDQYVANKVNDRLSPVQHDWSQAELDERYTEDNIRTVLY